MDVPKEEKSRAFHVFLVLLVFFLWEMIVGSAFALDAPLAPQAPINQDRECLLVLGAQGGHFRAQRLGRRAEIASPVLSRLTLHLRVRYVLQASSALRSDAPCREADVRIVRQALSRQAVV